MTADHYLDAAHNLLGGSFPDTSGRWPRACAWLLRLALEDTLREFWTREYPAIVQVSMRAQLLSLRRVHDLDRAVPARADHLWAVLSRACHYHPYELSPTASELRGWHDEVHSLTALLAP